MRWNGSFSAPSSVSFIVASPIFWPHRAACTWYGARLMFSTPPARAISQSPALIAFAAVRIACNPLPHRRFTVVAGTSCGIPPSITAMREMYMSRGSVCRICPNTASPTSAGSIPLRASASRATAAASTEGEVSFSAPPNVPTAVRTPETMKTSVMGKLLLRVLDARAAPSRGRFHTRGCRELRARRIGLPVHPFLWNIAYPSKGRALLVPFRRGIPAPRHGSGPFGPAAGPEQPGENSHNAGRMTICVQRNMSDELAHGN